MWQFSTTFYRHCMFGLKFMVSAFSALVLVAPDGEHSNNSSSTSLWYYLLLQRSCNCLFGKTSSYVAIVFCFSSCRRDYWSLAIVFAWVLQCIWLCLELGINHRKMLLQVVDWWLHFMCAGSGELLDDIVRHGCHDVYWSYSFERQVATYMGISTNQKLNEVSYINFFVHRSFTLAYSCLQEDHDGLLLHQKDLHTHLQCSRDYYRPPIRNPLECDEWHVCCSIVARSQDMAMKFSKLLSKVNPCEC